MYTAALSLLATLSLGINHVAYAQTYGFHHEHRSARTNGAPGTMLIRHARDPHGHPHGQHLHEGGGSGGGGGGTVPHHHYHHHGHHPPSYEPAPPHWRELAPSANAETAMQDGDPVDAGTSDTNAAASGVAGAAWDARQDADEALDRGDGSDGGNDGGQRDPTALQRQRRGFPRPDSKKLNDKIRQLRLSEPLAAHPGGAVDRTLTTTADMFGVDTSEQREAAIGGRSDADGSKGGLLRRRNVLDNFVPTEMLGLNNLMKPIEDNPIAPKIVPTAKPTPTSANDTAKATPAAGERSKPSSFWDDDSDDMGEDMFWKRSLPDALPETLPEPLGTTPVPPPLQPVSHGRILAKRGAPAPALHRARRGLNNPLKPLTDEVSENLLLRRGIPNPLTTVTSTIGKTFGDFAPDPAKAMALARNAQKQRNPGAAQPPAADGAATDSATTNDGAANDGTAGGGSGGATNDGGNDLNDGATTADAADADPAASAEAKTPPKMVERPQLISSDEPHQLNDPRINNPEADDDAGRTKGRAMDAAMEDRVPAIPDRADGADNEADADTQKVADQVMHESEQPRAAVAANNDERDGDDRNDPDTGAGAAAGDDADADNDTDASARADGEAPASGADEGDVPEREESSAVRALANALPPKRARPQILDEEEGRDGLMAGLQSRKASDLRGSPAGHSSAGQRHPGHPGRPGRHHRFAARGLVPAPIAALLPFKLEEGDTKDPEAALNKAPVFGDKGLISDPAVIDASTPNAAPNEGMDVSGTAAPTAGSAAPAAAAPKAKRSMLDGLPGFLGFFRTTETQEIKNLTATEAAAPPEAFDDPKFAEPTELEIEEPKLKANATRDVLAGGDLIPPRANAVAKAPPKRLARRGLPIPNPLDLLAGFFGSKRQEDEAAAAPNGGGGGGENGAEVPNSAESEPVSPPNAVSNGTAKPALSNMTETDAASREPAGGPMTTSIGPFRPDLASALALPLPLPLGSPAADAASGGHGHGGDHGQGHEAPRNDGHDGAFNGTATPVASQKQTASQPLDWKAVRAAADQLPVTTSTPEGEAEPSESVERGPATTRPGESADHGREGAHGGPDAAEAADGGADRHRAGPSSREGRSTSGPAASGPTDLPSDVDDAGLTPGNRTASDTAWAEADEAFDGQVLDDDRDDREVGTASDAGEPGGPADAPEGSHPHREPEPGAGAGAELEAEPATAPDAARPRASAWSPDMLSETERRAQLPGAAGSAPEARLAAPDRERAGRAAAVPHATKNSQNLGRRQRRAIGNGLPFVMKRVRNTLTNAPDQPGIFDIPDIDPAEIPSDKPSQANEPTSMGFRPPSPFGGAKKPLTH